MTSTQDCLSGQLDGTSIQLLSLLSRHNLIEPGGLHHSYFTYHHPSLGNRKSQLDRVYVNFSHHRVGFAQHVSYSDHYLVSLFLPKHSDVGPRPWRFLNDLLLDESFSLQIELILQGHNQSDPTNLWELIKNKIQVVSQNATQFHQN